MDIWKMLCKFVPDINIRPMKKNRKTRFPRRIYTEEEVENLSNDELFEGKYSIDCGNGLILNFF